MKIEKRPSMMSSLQTNWDFYYWKETMCNKEGETLKECLNNYGVGISYSVEKNMIIAIIFLSSEKVDHESFLLGLKPLDGGEQAVIRLQEEDPMTYKLSLETSLGTHITNLLAACVVKRV